MTTTAPYETAPPGGRAAVVTGAGGFVGSEIALALSAAGFDVTATDQAIDPETRARLAPLRMIEAPLHDALPSLPQSPFAVIHGAAITASPDRIGTSNAGHIRQNMDLLVRTIEWARDAGADRFLFLSSTGVFEPGDAPLANGRLDERSRPSGIHPYSAAKRAGEIVTAGSADPGFATLSLRLGNIFGPHEAVRPTRQVLCLVARMIEAARARGAIRVETPGALRDWAWLPDLAKGIARLVARFPGVPLLHAGTPPVLTDLQLAQAIAARLPDTRVVAADTPGHGFRPPMGSGVASAMDGVAWTGIEQALGVLLQPQAVS